MGHGGGKIYLTAVCKFASRGAPVPAKRLYLLVVDIIGFIRFL
jgi:hypothetical protein